MPKLDVHNLSSVHLFHLFIVPLNENQRKESSFFVYVPIFPFFIIRFQPQAKRIG